MSVAADAMIEAIDQILADVDQKPLMDITWTGGDHRENFRKYVEERLMILHALTTGTWDLQVKVNDVYPSVGWGNGFHDMNIYVGVRNEARGLYSTTKRLFIVRDVMMYNLVGPEKPWFNNGKGLEDDPRFLKARNRFQRPGVYLRSVQSPGAGTLCHNCFATS